MYPSSYWAALGLSLGLACGQVQAVPLSTLLLPGGSLSAGDFTLTGWVLPTSMLAPPDLTKIEVTATVVNELTLNVTFNAADALTLAGVSELSFIDLALAYTITTSDRLALDSAMQGLDGYSVIPSDSILSGVFVNQYLYRQPADSNPEDPATNALAVLMVQVDPGFSGTQTTASAPIAGAGHSAYVYTNTLVVANQDETAGITSFVQRYDAVPAPGTWLLLAGGVALLARQRAGRARSTGPAD